MRAELDRHRRADRARRARSVPPPCRSTTGCPTRRPPTSSTTATRRPSTSTPSSPTSFARIRAEIPKVVNVLVFDGDAPDGMTARRPAGRRPRRPPTFEIGPSTDAGGATMIYTSRHDRQAEGGVPAHRRRSAGRRRADAAHRLPARRRLPHDRAAVPLRPRRVRRERHRHGPDRRAAAQVRPRGLAAAPRDLPGDLDVLGTDADPDDLQPARRREGEVRPVVDAA